MPAAHVRKPLDRRRDGQVLGGRVSNRRFDLTAHRIQIQLVEVELEFFANIGIITARAERSLLAGFQLAASFGRQLVKAARAAGIGNPPARLEQTGFGHA